MASANGVPDRSVANFGNGEQEPLLGSPGDASQQDGTPLYRNLWLGTGVIAQVGAWILVGIVWGSVFSNKLILFSAHPLLNSAGLLLVAQGALILQPTHTPEQKRKGTYVHAALMDLGLLALIGGLAVIETNKHKYSIAHFESPHAVLGVMTYALFIIQAAVGFAQYFIPQVFGGVDNAKKIYKYHRISGYVIFILALGTVAAATQTTYNKNVLHIELWATIVVALLILVGLLPRIKKQKLGL